MSELIKQYERQSIERIEWGSYRSSSSDEMVDKKPSQSIKRKRKSWSKERSVYFIENKDVFDQIDEVVIHSESACSSDITFQQQF